MLVSMILLYLALAYLAGIALGRLAWSAGWLDCTWPDGLWVVPLALLPLLPTLNSLPFFRPRPIPLRWPREAGFVTPRSGPSPALIIALGVCLLIGVLRYASHPLEPCWTPADLAYYNLPADQAFDSAAPLVTITGYVSSYPLVSDTKQRVEVAAEQVEVDGTAQWVQGQLRLNTNIRQRYRYGQPVQLVGRLVTPPVFEDFSYREYLARKGIHSLLYSARIEELPGSNRGHPLLRMLYAFRAHGEALLNRLLPEPYAGLANGMLLGIESGIPDDLYEQFNLTGTSHTIVISGSNVAVIAGLFLAFGQRLFGHRHAVWPALIGIGCYALLVGGDAAVLRASLMGGLCVVAIALGRRSTALVSLAAACWVMTLVNPLTLWDVGFQLSSAATAGLILFTPGIEAAFKRLWSKEPDGLLPPIRESAAGQLAVAARGLMQGLLVDSLITTIAANVTTLPLVIYYFGRLSVVSLLTNLVIAPVQPFIMLWGTLGLVTGVLGLSWVAWLILLVPWLCLVWTVMMVKWTAALPGASLEISGYNEWGLLLTYLLLAGLYWCESPRRWVQHGLNWVRTRWQDHVLGSSAAGAVGVGCILIWLGVFSLPDGRLHVYFLDIGQGDGILIQTPSGRQVLIDGGPSPERLFNELSQVMPFWDRTIDIVAVTNPDKDHMDAQVQLPARFQVTTALQTEATVANPDADLWRATLNATGAELQLQHQGGWIDLGDGVALWVLWPPPELFTRDQTDEQFFDNENSLVMKLTYGDFSVLLTGDAGIPAEFAMIAADAPVAATVLKVGHHGSSGSTSAPFVRAVNPQLAVIQVSADNTYGHPHQEVLNNLARRTVLRNDLHGRVHIYSDGQQLWLDTENNSLILN